MSRAKDARIARLQEALRISGFNLIAASRFAPTVWQKDQIQAWADKAIKASVARNPEGHDPEEGHGRNDEHAVLRQQQTPEPSGDPDNG